MSESYVLAKREYKDRLFNFLFGREENKPWMLDLYNAVNDSNYTDPEMIEYNTISENLYLGMHNDVSFLIANVMSVYEHQSSFNPNMPLRQMQYCCNLYEKYIRANKIDKYGSKQIMLPVPKLLVFYNGTQEQPEELILRLSDAFEESVRDKSDIQVRVRMLNINYGHNAELMARCEPLFEYAWLIDKARSYAREYKEMAIDRAILEMPKGYVIRDFVLIHREEVKKMFLSEYDVDEAIEVAKIDTELRTRAESIKNIMKNLKMTEEQAMEVLGIPESDFEMYRMRM